MKEYRLSIERLSPKQQQIEINKFITCGWNYIGNFNLADVHIFAVFQWNKSSKSIYPQGYGEHKTVNPIHADGFL